METTTTATTTGAVAEPQVRVVELAGVRASPFQARRAFSQEKLEELAQSIQELGLINPPVVRVVGEGEYELIAGERRIRAARLAGLEKVTVLVREVTDVQAEEMMLTENLQRDDLRPTEEAEAYQRMLGLRDAEGRLLYTQESLARKLGKEQKYVGKRLRLLACPEELRTAVNEGRVAVSVGILVGRIPDEKARAAAAREVLRPVTQELPLSFEQAKEMIQEKYLRSLRQCGFDGEDDGLVPLKLDDAGNRLLGGACTDCPFRSGNMLEDDELFSGGGRGQASKAGVVQDLCTKPSCYGKKQEAAWRIVRRQAEEQGMRVLEGDATRGIFRSQGAVDPAGPYVDAHAKPTVDEIGTMAQENGKSWKTLLAGCGVEVVMVRHPMHGRTVTMLDRKEALKAWTKLQAAEDGEGEVEGSRPLASAVDAPAAVGDGLEGEDEDDEGDGLAHDSQTSGQECPRSSREAGDDEEQWPTTANASGSESSTMANSEGEDEEEESEPKVEVADVWEVVERLMAILRNRPQVEVLERCFAPLRARFHLMASGESSAIPAVIQARLMNPQLWEGVPYPGLSWALVFAVASEVSDPEAELDVIFDVLESLKLQPVGVPAEPVAPVSPPVTPAKPEDEASEAPMSLEVQVMSVLAGRVTIAELVGKKPAKTDKEGLRVWAAARMRLRRAVDKAKENLATELG